MVAFNMLWKLCALVALGLSATATSTEVAQEQPTQEGLDIGIPGKEYEQATELVKVPEQDNTDSEKEIATDEPPKYSVEWYLLPKPENRKQLCHDLPWYLFRLVPKNCKKPISTALMNQIRWYFSRRDLQWFLLPKQENRTALRKLLPIDVAAVIPEDCRKAIPSVYEKYIWTYFSLSAVEWLLESKPENRSLLIKSLPSDLAKGVPEDVNKPIDPAVEERIREYFAFTMPGLR
ncbi:SmORF protein [Babesia bovis T2Bo]|uniref:SmORF n=1 Tax=Babesia bovis TaxID=5865 RepID=A7ALZ0_BABBO|nr:SmORF protein [Babesia bovis T2Bo]EDO07574.1 SmORF protein [Babesia bovis T2Bo]BAN64830.1 small open reading frame [Babesia bovis]|eukprot:XP_001611142.1 SmORF [Babesia bovis]